jgi:hypothetical protein
MKTTKEFLQMKTNVFAAELVLPIFEEKHPEDTRPRKAIEAAKKALEKDTLKNRRAAMIAAARVADYAVAAAYATAAAAKKEIQRKIAAYADTLA